MYSSATFLPSFEPSWVRRDDAWAIFYRPQDPQFDSCRQLVSTWVDHFKWLVISFFRIQNVSRIDTHETFHRPKLKPTLLYLYGNVFFQLPLDLVNSSPLAILFLSNNSTKSYWTCVGYDFCFSILVIVSYFSVYQWFLLKHGASL